MVVHFDEFRAICRIACRRLFGTNVAHDERLHTTQDLGESRNEDSFRQRRASPGALRLSNAQALGRDDAAGFRCMPAKKRRPMTGPLGHRDYPFGFDQRMRFFCINAPRLAECALQRMSPY
jgi:hypothetical protein